MPILFEGTIVELILISSNPVLWWWFQFFNTIVIIEFISNILNKFVSFLLVCVFHIEFWNFFLHLSFLFLLFLSFIAAIQEKLVAFVYLLSFLQFILFILFNFDRLQVISFLFVFLLQLTLVPFTTKNSFCSMLCDDLLLL